MTSSAGFAIKQGISGTHFVAGEASKDSSLALCLTPNGLTSRAVLFGVVDQMTAAEMM